MKQLLTVTFVALLVMFGLTMVLAQERPFVTTWKGETGQEIQVPIEGIYKVTLVAPDGVETNVARHTGTYSFTPSQDGIYTLKAGPEGVETLNMNCTNTTSRKALLQLVDFGTVEWKSMESFFFGCENMTFQSGIEAPNLENIRSLYRMFWECRSFNQPLEEWDVSHVTNMSHMFYCCSSFNQPLEMWDVSHVTDMSGMFINCTYFNQPLAGWNVSHVTSMKELFSNCKFFNQPLEEWDVSSVTDMSSMFANCAFFNQPLAGWNVSHVTDMNWMFGGCNFFNQPLAEWDVSHVTDMSSMFDCCALFNQPLERWDVSHVTDMSSMFDCCALFNQPLERWDVSNVTNMENMFASCNSFNQPLGRWKIKSAVGGLASTAMSTTNYSASLVGWASQDIRDISFGEEVRNLIYNTEGQTARATLIGRGWAFTNDRYEAQGIAIAVSEYSESKKVSLAVNEKKVVEIDVWGGLSGDPTVTILGDVGIVAIEGSSTGRSVTLRGLAEGDVILQATLGTHTSECKVKVKKVTVKELVVFPVKKMINLHWA